MTNLFIFISELIIPKPTLDVESVSTYSIAINWTMPFNELYDGFRVAVSLIIKLYIMMYYDKDKDLYFNLFFNDKLIFSIIIYNLVFVVRFNRRPD